MLTSCLDRLEEAIDLETTALLMRDLSSLEGLSRRKNEDLLEIFTILNASGDCTVSLAFNPRIADLQEKMRANLALIGDHMRTTQKVAMIVSGAKGYADLNDSGACGPAAAQLAAIA